MMQAAQSHAGFTRGAVALVVLAGSALVGPVLAQGASPSARGVLRGQVRDEAGRPLAGASLSVIGTRVGGESDDVGAYRLAGLVAGDALLVSRRIGYAPETTLVRVETGGNAPLDIILRRVAVSLDAVVVRGRRDLRGPLVGFYARMARGHGRFFTQDQIARRNPARMSDLLRGVPGLRIESRRFGEQSFRLRGARQAPLVWLDGTPMGAAEVDLDMFDPRSFAAIEVYSGSATVPVEFSGGRAMSTSGGAILLWSKEGAITSPRRPKGAPSPAVVLAGLLERQEAFTADGVDTRARTASLEPIRPMYPDSLFNARLAGRVEVEFVVDATGRVRMETFGVVTTTHRLLTESVRQAIGDRAWSPASRAGQPVSQLVQLPFEFLPDSGVVERKPKE